MAIHEENLKKAKIARDKAESDFQKILENEKNIANNLADLWLGKKQPSDVTVKVSVQKKQSKKVKS